MNSLELWAVILSVFVLILGVGWLVDRLEGRPRSVVDLRTEIRAENLATLRATWFR